MDMWSGTDYRTSYTHKKGRATMPGTPQLPEGITPADHVPGPRQGEWTYSHYAALPDDGHRYEILDGVLYVAPLTHTVLHQHIAVCIGYYFYLYVTLKDIGNVIPGPIDVEFAPRTVVQPDLLVLLGGVNDEFLASSHITGPPDLVVEILEPHTAGHDRGRKYNAYARGGVREYWIVDPLVRSVEIYALEASIYHLLGVFRGDDFLPSWVIKDFTVRVNQFFI
jgi:Uma2 family endonuclease